MTVRLHRDGPIACLVLDRPEAGNALTPEMARALRSALEDLDADETVRAVVLWGEGNAFCAGPLAPDLGDARTPEEVRRRLEDQQTAIPLALFPKPVVVAVRGPAVGQGMELALAGDIRLAGRSARFALPHLRHGLLPWDGGSQRLLRLAGRGALADLLLTGREVGAEEALALGLVHQVVDDDALTDLALQTARRIAHYAPIAARYAKELVWKGLDLPLEHAFRMEADLAVLLHSTRDRAEGIRSFLEKRTPHYEGR